MDASCLCILIYKLTESLRLNCHVYALLRKQRHFLWVSSFLIILFCLQARNQSFNLASRTTGIENTNNYSISSRGKQLFKRSCLYRHARKNLPSFCFRRIYNSRATSWLNWKVSQREADRKGHTLNVISLIIIFISYLTTRVVYFVAMNSTVGYALRLFYNNISRVS